VKKIYLDLFLEPRSLPESDGLRDHGGIVYIGGSKNKYFFLIVFQLMRKTDVFVWWPQIGYFCTISPRKKPTNTLKLFSLVLSPQPRTVVLILIPSTPK